MTPQPPVARAMRAHPLRSSEAGSSRQLCPRAVGSGTTFLRGERGLGGDSSLTLAPRLDAAEPSSAAAAGSTEMRQVWFGGFKSLNCSKRVSALDVSLRGEST